MTYIPVIARILENIPRGQTILPERALRVRAILFAQGEYFPNRAITDLLYDEKIQLVRLFPTSHYAIHRRS